MGATETREWRAGSARRKTTRIETQRESLCERERKRWCPTMDTRKMKPPRCASARRRSSKENASGAPWCRRAARPPPDRRLSPPRTSPGRCRRRAAERRLPSGTSGSSRKRSSRRRSSRRCPVGRLQGHARHLAGGVRGRRRPCGRRRCAHTSGDEARTKPEASRGVWFLFLVRISFMAFWGFCGDTQAKGKLGT